MNLQTFVPYIPFLAVIYALFALVQALRHKQQGVGAIILALIAIAAPLIAYALSSAPAVLASLIFYMALNVAIVFAASLLTLWIERRNASRSASRSASLDPNRSYGMLGLGLSVLLAVGIFALPLLPASSSNAAAVATVANATNGDTVLISNQTSNNLFKQALTPAATASPADVTAPQVQATAVATTEASTDGNTVTAPVASEDSSIIKPTRIVFPTDTPTPDATEASTAEAVGDTTGADSTAASAVTCTLAVDYNLNLRTQPTSVGSSVLLTIPFGTAVTSDAVTSDAVTSDGWYRVSYQGQTGWVSGQYVTAPAACASLPVAAAS